MLISYGCSGQSWRSCNRVAISWPGAFSQGVYRLYFYQADDISLKNLNKRDLNRAELNRIMERADALLKPDGFWCIEAEWDRQDELLRLYVDQEGGVDMDSCVRATFLLRDQELLAGLPAGSFNLEVSSPGAERPLRRVEDFRSSDGHDIRLQLLDQSEGPGRILTGRLLSVSCEEELSLESDEGALTIPLSSVYKASLL